MRNIQVFENRKAKDHPRNQPTVNPIVAFSNTLRNMLQSIRLLNKLDSILLNDLCRVFDTYDAEHPNVQKQTYGKVKLCLKDKEQAEDID